MLISCSSSEVTQQEYQQDVAVKPSGFIAY